MKCDCGNEYTVTCDYPVNVATKELCNLPMCDDCTQKGASQETDFCEPHYIEARQAYERRLAKLQPSTPNNIPITDSPEKSKAERRGMSMNAMGLVDRNGDAFAVKTPSLRGNQQTHYVALINDSWSCDCLDFENNVIADKKFKCEHLWAVQYYEIEQLKKLNKEVENESKEL